ncbi:hypothetical protein K9U71_03555, partial [Pseudomonas aeruginosa]|uniref:hypothetical protein n=1 Tax=Pseudomonas aeruginosa TaxID=287 RepID=UPI001F06F9AD
SSGGDCCEAGLGAYPQWCPLKMVGTIVAIQSFGRQWVQGGRLRMIMEGLLGSNEMTITSIPTSRDT